MGSNRERDSIIALSYLLFLDPIGTAIVFVVSWEYSVVKEAIFNGSIGLDLRDLVFVLRFFYLNLFTGFNPWQHDKPNRF